MVDAFRTHIKLQTGKMKGFNQIATLKDNLYLSGVAAITEQRLQKYGITHVLNTAIELKDFEYPSCVVDVLRVEMKDKSSENLLKYIDECIEYIHKVRNDGGKVLVHCIAGMSRSVSVCLGYLVKYENMTLKASFDLIFEQRRFIYPNEGFWKSLIQFEEQILDRNTVEIRPYVCGWEINVVEYETDFRIINGWMEDLFRCYFTPFLFLTFDLFSLLFLTNRV